MKLTKDNCRAVCYNVSFYVEIDIPEIKEGHVIYGKHVQIIPMSGCDEAHRLVRILTEDDKS